MYSSTSTYYLSPVEEERSHTQLEWGGYAAGYSPWADVKYVLWKIIETGEL